MFVEDSFNESCFINLSINWFCNITKINKETSLKI